MTACCALPAARPRRVPQPPLPPALVCHPINVDWACWMCGPPPVSWQDYQVISGTQGWRAWWQWARGQYDHEAFALDAEALDFTRQRRCHVRRDVQVHFCGLSFADGLGPNGTPGPIAWDRRVPA